MTVPGLLPAALAKLILIAVMLALGATVAMPAAVQTQPLPFLEQLIERFSDIQLNLPVPDREEPLVTLLHDAEAYRDSHHDNAEAWITTGRIRAGFAATQAATSRPALLKAVKADMEKAIAIDPAAQEGRAQAFLGMLYAILPGWPVSFGDQKKAALLLDEALGINDSNTANCYYYAQYLISTKQYRKAQDYLLRSRAAVNADMAHPRWQKFQQKNIADSLQVVSGKL